MLRIEGLNHATFPISDIDKTRDFYGRILGLRELPRPDMPGAPRGAFFACGAGEVHLAENDAAFRRELIAININPHVALTVESGWASLGWRPQRHHRHIFPGPGAVCCRPVLCRSLGRLDSERAACRAMS